MLQICAFQSVISIHTRVNTTFPGTAKVIIKALGRLVRAPGQRAKVLLHCRRFAEESYADLLAPEYQTGREIASDADLAAWLAEH
ncbi:MAG: hypothetical protein A3G75_05580 [Verrucomicrobia bacterium RIFCSPLOWO2_12_FULL_64_8]|nr:MAG: hypothetical protein A3G75_05580 [Verrucomicrobia bacterium RIFCSPLOWO2_12_FULL_64_8]